MYRILLADLDDTLLDFRRSERTSLTAALERFGLPVSGEILEAYSRINVAWWQRLERGEISREEVFTGRFGEFLQRFGSGADPKAVGDLYEKGLEKCAFVLPGTYAALRRLRREGRRIYAASNGSARVQHSRLRLSGLDRLLDGAFISEDLALEKPSEGFFREVSRRIPGFRKEECLMIGDSLTSDILGAQQAGIASVWIRRPGARPREGIRPCHTVSSFSLVPALLHSLEGTQAKEQ